MGTDISTRFYRLTNAEKHGEIRVKPILAYDKISIKRGDVAPLYLNVRIDKGKKYYDILCFQDPHNFAFSDRIHHILLENQITGYRSYPLVIEGSGEKYWGIQVIGRAGPPFRRDKGFIEGLDFDRTTWDGSDIFLLEGTLFTLLSERLRDLLVKHKTTNLELDEISTITWYNSKE